MLLACEKFLPKKKGIEGYEFNCRTIALEKLQALVQKQQLRP